MSAASTPGEDDPKEKNRGALVLHVPTPPMRTRAMRTALLAAALGAAAWTAHSFPAAQGGLMPAALLGIGVTARELRRRTSPESKRA
jgi:hypothetical protein